MGDDRNKIRTICKVKIQQAIILTLYIGFCYCLDFFLVARTATNSTLNDFEVFVDTNEPFVRKVDVPFFWHIPKSGGTSLKNMYSQCYNMVEASESGIANGHDQDTSLSVVVIEEGKYANVDVTTEAGLKRAVSFKLAESNVVDLIVSPLLHPSTALFSTDHRGRMVTVFRDPVDRVISLFFYLRQATWEPTYEEKFKNMTLKEFAFSPFCESNFVSRSLLNKMEEPLTGED